MPLLCHWYARCGARTTTSPYVVGQFENITCTSQKRPYLVQHHTCQQRYQRVEGAMHLGSCDKGASQYSQCCTCPPTKLAGDLAAHAGTIAVLLKKRLSDVCPHILLGLCAVYCSLPGFSDATSASKSLIRFCIFQIA
jgi:hypothetical protein